MEIKKIRMKRIFEILAPRVGFEPTTLRLTAGCSTVELRRHKQGIRSSESLVLALTYLPGPSPDKYCRHW